MRCETTQEVTPVAEILTLAEAVRRFVTPGAHVSLGGFTISRQTMALTYEIIRQGIRDLHITLHSGGQALDLLVGAGCVRSVEIAYGGNGRFAPTCFRFRKAVQDGTLPVEDYTNYQMAMRFWAGSVGLPFMPILSGMETDIERIWGFSEGMRRDARLPDKKLVVMDNPFRGEPRRVVLVPAINPDVTLLHVQKADHQGTVRIEGLTFTDIEQAKASRHVVVTCEEIVEPAELRADPNKNQIPFFMVSALVHAPYGAHPTSCHGYYDYDAVHLNEYARLANDDARFRAFLDHYVFGANDHQAYLERVGAEALRRIRAQAPFGYAPGVARG